MSESPNRGGRPTRYTPIQAERICWQLTEGLSLYQICAKDEFPCVATVFNWLNKYPKFVEQYARAREIQAHYYAGKQLEVANEAYDSDSASAARVKAEALRWMAGKLLPKVYGDKLLHTGADGTGPIQHHMKLDLSLLSEADLVAWRQLVDKATPRKLAAPGVEIEGDVVEAGVTEVDDD